MALPTSIPNLHKNLKAKVIFQNTYLDCLLLTTKYGLTKIRIPSAAQLEKDRLRTTKREILSTNAGQGEHSNHWGLSE